MQNKGLIWTFIVLLTLACLYQLSFTWVAQSVESDAVAYANGDTKVEEAYLDSMASEEVYPVLNFTYSEVRKNTLNLGLDLKGGMNVTLEVNVAEVIKALSSRPEDEDFINSLELAKEKQKSAQENFVDLFAQAWTETAGDRQMTAVFYGLETKEKIDRNATNEQVIEFLREEADAAFDRTFEVLRTRVNLFGVAQPNIQKLQASDRILVELPGVKNKDRVRQLLQGTAKLEFWETYENAEIYPYLATANDRLNKILKGEELETVEVDSTNAKNDSSLVETADDNALASLGDVSPDSTLEEDLTTANDSNLIADDSTDEGSILEQLAAEDDADGDSTNIADQNFEDFAKDNPLFAVLTPSIYQNAQGNYTPGEGPTVGFVAIKDTAKVNDYLNRPEIKEVFPTDLRLLWTAKPYDDKGQFLQLIAIEVNSRDGRAPLEGDVITDAFQDFGQFGGRPQITMKMNALGAKTWKRLTGDNVGNSIAIVLDNFVYSFPNVNSEIAGGISSIEGDFTIEEAKLIANILKAGKLPAPAKIVEEAVVGPSLGLEAITSGLNSFLIALLIVLVYMIFYYGKAGIASDIALLANLFFIMGVLASTNIALTLPGIAGIVLTIGISVDANVLIYERIREELRAGKGARLAITDGYNNAYSSIIDANVTTLLTGVILWFFGTGPVEGFAKTLVIGIITSLFSAIFITRLIFAWRLDRKMKVTVSTKLTEGAFQNINLGFVKNRKMYYIISGLIIALGIGSFMTRGLSYGVDFTGGRTYLVRFDETVSTTDVRNSLAETFVTEEGVNLAPEVKVFGEDNQVKVTTSFMIDSDLDSADMVVETRLNDGLGSLGLDYEIMSSQKVGPTIADDIKKSAVWAVLFSLVIIFLYILFRFRKWQYGLGAIAAIFHDVLIVLAVFSIAYGFLPFSLDIDQAFIAAILTVVGYSINDTVVVFDRIREFLNSYKKRPMNEVINDALNSTLSRTVNTSLSTFFVLLMIFIFGGEVIRGFAFALLVGVAVGTYSSLCVATPIVVDLTKTKEKLKKKK
ncbi:MAG: protein translocase subunit SecDF [Flavobacteriales bacterium]|nr:protein translocase subunit SecDF [Flavobacteriales bacterium]|tara:strand:+ start:425 stop:3523 length:3099 start_codon:yes stop_codon:yes gene_type:complete